MVEIIKVEAKAGIDAVGKIQLVAREESMEIFSVHPLILITVEIVENETFFERHKTIDVDEDFILASKFKKLVERINCKHT